MSESESISQVSELESEYNKHMQHNTTHIMASLKFQASTAHTYFRISGFRDGLILHTHTHTYTHTHTHAGVLFTELLLLRLRSMSAHIQAWH
jgi:hypothetical protein